MQAQGPRDVVSVDVSGAGVASLNGTYTRHAELHGKPAYRMVAQGGDADTCWLWEAEDGSVL